MRTFQLLIMLFGVAALSAADVASRSSSSDVLAANGDSSIPLLTPDGRYMLFVSSASNLTTNATDGRSLNLYLHNLITSNTVLVSATPAGTGGNGNSAWATISSNGQSVAFISEATNLVDNDTNASPDIFVREIASGVTRIVSRGLDGGVSLPVRNARNTATPLISADGRFVVYETLSTNLVSQTDRNEAPDVVMADLERGTNVLVARGWLNPAQTLTNGARLAGITPGAERVAFITSPPGEIEFGLMAAGSHVFVRSMTNSQTFWVSALQSYYTNTYECVAATLSADGRFVATTVNASNYPTRLFRCAVGSQAADLVALQVRTNAPFISADGRYIAFGDGTNVYRWDGNGGAAELVNVTTAEAAPEQGRAVLYGIAPDGNSVLFASDSPAITSNSTAGTWQIYRRSMSAGLTVDVAPLEESLAEYLSISFSSDASVVAFDSASGEIVAGDRNTRNDVFVRDIAAGSTSLISRRHIGFVPRRTGLGHAYQNSSCISSNGEYILFSSFDSDIVPNDTNKMADLFLYSAVDSTVERVLSDERFTSFALSGLGRHFLYVTETGKVVRVDRETGAKTEMQGAPRLNTEGVPAIRPDGALIAYRRAGGFQVCDGATGSVLFSTNGTMYPVRSGLFLNLNSRDALFTPDSQMLLFYYPWLWLWDELAGARFAQGGVTWSLPAGMEMGAVSANSRFVAGSASHAMGRYDLIQTNLMWLGSFPQPVVDYAISGDGRFVVGATSNSRPQVVYADFETGQTGYISTTPAGLPGNGRSYAPTISANGRYVAYLSDATDIVPGNTNGARQVLLRDRLLGSTMLLSANPNGEPGMHHSSRPTFSTDGSTLVFQSMADNLVAGDLNERRDIFVVKIGGADSDNDGLDDEWEVTYYGDLTHNGEADTDADGTSDRDEFLAGTDPTNSGSVFRVVALAQIGSSDKRLIWSGASSRSYRVEFKDDLNTPGWLTLNAPITWAGSTASVIDSESTSTRFYRVVRLP